MTREQLVAYKRKGMYISDIARKLGMNRSTVEWYAKKHKVAFSHKPFKPVRDMHPWAKHRKFGILDAKGIAYLLDNERILKEKARRNHA